MTEREAKKIGGKQGIICVVLGLLIAQLIMTALLSADISFLEALCWFTKVDFKLNIFIGAVIMIVCGQFVGQLAGKAILIKKWNFVLVGCLSGIAVLLLTAFFSGWAGFFQEGTDNIGTNDNPFEDYIFKPFYWVTVFGMIPALLVGIWLGARISRKGRSMADKVIS